MENKEIHISTDLEPEAEHIEIIGIHTICRLCATQNERLIGIYSEEGVTNDLSNKINLYLPIKVATTDELPLQCCWNCASTLLAWHELVVTSVEIDRKFKNAQFIGEKHVPDCEDPAFDNPDIAISDDNEGCDNEGQNAQHDNPNRKSGFCEICQATLSRARDLKRHMTKCHPHSLPTPQSNNTTNTKNFDDVADLTTKTCTECNLSFDNRTKLRKHVEEVHKLKQTRSRRKKNEILPQFFCDACEKGFTRKHDMQKHRSQAHSLSERSEEKKNLEVLLKCRNVDSDGRVYYKCEFCQRKFAQSYNLMRHRTIHTGVREFFCHICGMRFRMSNNLNRHIQSFHYRVKKFSCDVCKKAFTARATRDEHMNIHTDNRPFVCDICGKSFKQRASLHVHKVFHSDKCRFECSTCGKKFRRKQDLKVHGWLHTGHRPHSCPKCKSSFRLKYDLTRHLRSHEKPSECVCNVCGSVFSQERYLKVHKKIHENVEAVYVKMEESVV